mgnify:CR=1 FL=1
MHETFSTGPNSDEEVVIPTEERAAPETVDETNIAISPEGTSIEIADSLVNPESLPPNETLADSAAIENSEFNRTVESIEIGSTLAETHEATLAEIQQLPQEEQAFITTEIEQSPEGKSIIATIKEKFAHLVHAQSKLEQKLTDEHNYNPKLIKMVGRIGNIAGGIGGTIAGHGFLGAATSVAGSKAGGMWALKGFEKVAANLPQSMREKLLAKASPEQIERLASAESEKAKALEIHEAKLAKLKEVMDRVAHLSPEDQQAFAQGMEHNIKAQTGAEVLSEAHTKHQTLFEKFEHKFPMLATATEYTTHVLIGPSLHALGIGKDVLHAIELMAAGGGAEHLTKKLVNSGKHLGDILNKFKNKVSNLVQRKENILDVGAAQAA